LMSRIEQWVAFAISIVVLGGSVLGGTYWYVSMEAPKIIAAELDKRDADAINNKPDEIVAALAILSTEVAGLTTAQTELRLEIRDNFKWLSDKIMEL